MRPRVCWPALRAFPLLLSLEPEASPGSLPTGGSRSSSGSVSFSSSSSSSSSSLGRGGIVLPMMVMNLYSAPEKFSGMRWVMSAPCWMLRHSCADVIAGAEVQQNGADATRRRGGAAAGRTARLWRDQPSRFAAPDCSRKLHVEVIVLNLTSREIQSYLEALEACRLQCCKWRRGTKLFE